MDTIRIDLSGVRQVGLRFEQFPDALYDDLKKEIDALSADLLASVESATPVRAGTLKGQERVRVYTDRNRITGYLYIESPKGADYAKAAALEYGAHKKTNVESHSRKLDHIFDRKLAAPMDVIVKAYPRTPNITETSFLRDPLAALQPQVVTRLNAVVERATAKASA